ncbi:hypothetical protein B0H34DRAFT_802687 [Crassisporium funariophilum]|nr:hypothetical protein B0H34DRAFT_802687 [Crassisporium funariophilum]
MERNSDSPDSPDTLKQFCAEIYVSSASASTTVALSSNVEHLKFQAAFATANGDRREAPWYGVWNWVLENVIFDDFGAELIGERVRTTVTYPQYPLTQGIDTNEDDYDAFMSPPSTPPLIGTENPTLPAHHHPRSSFARPPSTSWATASLLPPLNLIAGPSPPPQPKRSTQIPDFAEILHEFVDGKLRKHLLLIVENKPKPSAHRPSSFLQVLRQTKEQATHALLSGENAHVEIIGVIVALGQHWQYVEYHRGTLITPAVQERRSRSDDTYIDEDEEAEEESEEESEEEFEEESTIEESYSEYQGVKVLYDENLRCCSLNTERSGDALLALRKRMLELAAMY